MNKDNKNTELDNTDKKLHISDVIFWFKLRWLKMKTKYYQRKYGDDLKSSIEIGRPKI
jgi:hypothetical protein